MDVQKASIFTSLIIKRLRLRTPFERYSNFIRFVLWGNFIYKSKC